MARPLRLEFAGALYHVISRGNERKPIARDDADRAKRLDWLQRTVKTYGWRLVVRDHWPSSETPARNHLRMRRRIRRSAIRCS